MSTTQQTVQVDLLGERRDAELLEEIPGGNVADGPITLCRVAIGDSTYRVDAEDVVR